MRAEQWPLWSVVLWGSLGGCAGSGAGLDANGEPVSAPTQPPPLTADLASIQENVFTPICVRCHAGAGAPEGLQLDADHSYGLLVGVPSAEVGTLLRVAPGEPDQSYLILKLTGGNGIAGAQMPYGGPYLPQSTIDVIRQWIAAGAPPADAGGAALEAGDSAPATDGPAAGAPAPGAGGVLSGVDQ